VFVWSTFITFSLTIWVNAIKISKKHEFMWEAKTPKTSVINWLAFQYKWINCSLHDTQLTYRQHVCRTIWNDVWSRQKEGSYVTSKQTRLLNQSEDWIVCVSLVMYTCIVWRNMLSLICRSIRRHFKRFVDTLIYIIILILHH